MSVLHFTPGDDEVNASGGAVAAGNDNEWTRAEVEAQLQQIIDSRHFRNSALLQNFLRFVVSRTLGGTPGEISEHSIATEVFGRRADFDSAVDTVVRSQAYRLRAKLQEYYTNEGVEDVIVIDIPKGRYVPSFKRRVSGGGEQEAHATVPGPQLVRAARVQRRSKLVGVLVVVLAFALGAVCSMAIRRNPLAAKSPVDAFWLAFLGSDRQPIVAYSNQIFVSNDEQSFVLARGSVFAARGAVADSSVAVGPEHGATSKDAKRVYYEGDITGVGEVLAAVAIERALARIDVHPAFKRSQSVTTYDLQTHNVIFLGSRISNPLLNEVPRPFENFRAQQPLTGPLLYRAFFENTKPKPGEAAAYGIELAEGTHVITTDHAVAGLYPGIAPGRKILILGGLTTSGTAAAADFVTSTAGIAEMQKRLPDRFASAAKWPGYFEYLLKVKVSQGIDVVHYDCLTSRVGSSSN